MRVLTILFGCLAVGSCLGQSQLVLTRLPDSEIEIIDWESILQLDLGQFFQFYDAPGPVATFTIDMPELEEEDLLFVYMDTPIRIAKYKLKSGGTYDNPFEIGADEYLWTQHHVEFQLLADQVPNTVANFMTYVADGAYDNTVIHRNESTGQIFGPHSLGTDFVGFSFTPLPLLQAGAFRLYEDDDYIMERVESRAPVHYEAGPDNTMGTLAMARKSGWNSATSQFFINLEDNTFLFEDPHTVYGELVDPEGDLPILANFAKVPVYDLSSPFSPGVPNFFPTLPFQAIPLYAPYPYEKDSFSRITSIAIPEGTKDGVLYTHEWINAGDEPDRIERDGQNAFDVQIEGSILSISRNDTGEATIRIIGSDGAGQTAEFQIKLMGYDSDVLNDVLGRFPNSQISRNGWIDIDWYGWVNAEIYPKVYHFNHGYQHISEFSTATTFYIYDYRLDSWIYTTSPLYPFLYSYKVNAWLMYLKDTGSYDTSRWFYLYDSSNPRWIIEDEI